MIPSCETLAYTHGFLAAALKRSMTYAFTYMGNFLLFEKQPQRVDVLQHTGVNFHTSCEGIFAALVAIFHDIRWEFCIFSISCQFAMLFNGNFTFFSFFINFPCYSMGNMHFFVFFCKFSMLFNGKFAFCQFSMLFNGNLRLEKLRGDVRTDGWTDRRTDGRTKPLIELRVRN